MEKRDAIDPAETGSKFAAWHELTCSPGEEAIVESVLTRQTKLDPFAGLEAVLPSERTEADDFFHALIPGAA